MCRTAVLVVCYQQLSVATGQVKQSYKPCFPNIPLSKKEQTMFSKKFKLNDGFIIIFT